MDSDQYDIFVSYARADNREGWITRFVEELIKEHQKFAGISGVGGLQPFFDRADIGSLDDWQHRIRDGIAKSRLFLAFLSPSYFASEWCRREWREWIDTEISKHILSSGAAPIYIVEVPGFQDRQPLDEQQVAEKVARLCDVGFPCDDFLSSVAPLIGHVRARRQITDVRPFYQSGLEELRRQDLRAVLEGLARDLGQRAQDVQRAANSVSTVPPYNRNFTGRLDELLFLRERLKDDRAGVISGIHGLGGIGKTELAFTYAHAFAGAYPGGRFLVRCEDKPSLAEAIIDTDELTSFFREAITDEERKRPQTYYAAVRRCLRERIGQLGHVLLVLDNVSDSGLLRMEQTDELTSLGPRLHLLATTRLPPKRGGNWLTLGELAPADALRLLEKHRAFDSEAERAAAGRIVTRLGGFALAIELVAAWLAAHRESSNYQQISESIGLEDLERIAGDDDVDLRRHNHERRLSAILGPALGSLSPEELQTMKYAAVLPPDCIPLPWLSELMRYAFPNLSSAKGLDPYAEIISRLTRLAFLSRGGGEDGDVRLVRIHRMVQAFVRNHFKYTEDRWVCNEELESLAINRLGFLKTKDWREREWEIEPIARLGLLWADQGHPYARLLLMHLANPLLALGEYTRAEPLLRRAAEFIKGEQDYDEVGPALKLIDLLCETSRSDEADVLVRRTLQNRQEQHGPDDPGTVAALTRWAWQLQDRRQWKEAEAILRSALKISEERYGPGHRLTASALNNLASILDDLGRSDEAEQLLRRALKITENETSLNNLALVLKRSGRLVEAEPLYRRALALTESKSDPDHPDMALRLNNLAWLLQAAGRLEEAEPLMRRALEIHIDFFRRNSLCHRGMHHAVKNCISLWSDMGVSQREAWPRVTAMLSKADFSEEQMQQFLLHVFEASP